MRTLELVLVGIDGHGRAELENATLGLREPDDWWAGTRGLWRHSFEAFDGLRHFVIALADVAGLQWEQGGGFDLLATFESGDGANIMDDGLSISAVRGYTECTYAPLITVFVSDVTAFLGETPTAESAATAIRDALNETLAHFTAA